MGYRIRNGGKARKGWLLAGYFTILLFLGWWAIGQETYQLAKAVEQQVSRVVWEEVFALTEWSEDSLADIFAASVPLWPVAHPEDQPMEPANLIIPAPTPEESLAGKVVQDWLGIEIGEPESYLRRVIPLLAFEPHLQLQQQNPPVQIPQTAPPKLSVGQAVYSAEPEVKSTKDTLPGDPLVFIYNTHTGETYALTDKVVKVAGKRGGVFTVAQRIKARLEHQFSIKTAQSENIHDQNWLRSNPYAESIKTAQAAIKTYPNLKVMLDVHRDAKVPRANTVVTIKGRQVARIMLVVGTNSRNNHPKWLENYRFAQAVGKEMDKMYPGLLRKITTQPGRYNQHLHPQALLVEIGSTENTTEEACLAGELFADVIARLVKQN